MFGSRGHFREALGIVGPLEDVAGGGDVDVEAVAALHDFAGSDGIEEFGMEGPIVEAEDEFRDSGPKQE